MRNIFFWIHLVLGVTLGLVILSMCATGAVLAFEPQITNWSERSLRTVTPPAPDAERLDDDTLIAKAREAKPGARLSYVLLRPDPAVSMMAGFGKDGVLFVNPYTGEVLGMGSKTRENLHTIEEWHRWLGNKKIGKPITGAAAIAFFVLALSGIYLWWPRKVFTAKGAGHGKNWNWHNTLGITSALFILIITSTGIMMSYGLLNKKPTPQAQDKQAKPAEPAQPDKPPIKIIHDAPSKPKEFRGWIKPMHTGRAWGLPGQIINFLVALTGLLQIWTGFALAYRRFRKS